MTCLTKIYMDKREDTKMAISEQLFDVTRTLSNVKNHDYTVSDYKLCKNESDIVVKALNKYLTDLNYDERLKVFDATV